MIELQRELQDLRRAVVQLVQLLSTPDPTWEGMTTSGLAADAMVVLVHQDCLVGVVLLAAGTEAEVYDMDQAPASVVSLVQAHRKLLIGSAGFIGPPIRMRKGVLLRSVGGTSDVAVVWRPLTPEERAAEPA